MVIQMSNTTITNTAVLGPGKSKPKEEKIIIKRSKCRFQEKSQQGETHFRILQVEHSFSE